MVKSDLSITAKQEKTWSPPRRDCGSLRRGFAILQNEKLSKHKVICALLYCWVNVSIWGHWNSSWELNLARQLGAHTAVGAEWGGWGHPRSQVCPGQVNENKKPSFTANTNTWVPEGMCLPCFCSYWAPCCHSKLGVKTRAWLGMVAHALSPSTWRRQVGERLWVWHQPGLH